MSVLKPIRSDAIAEQANALPIGHAVGVAASRHSIGIRSWTLTLLLFLVPVVAYWPATFHEYGLRDDYSNLREAHEEPSTVLRFCASHARPIYGWLLQATYGQAGTVHNLQWMRFFASILLGAISLVIFRALRAVGWSFNTSLCFAVLVSLVPSAQVIAGWAVGWPYAAAALLGIGAFFTVEGALTVGNSAGIGRSTGQWMISLGLMIVGALIYQPSVLFYVVPLAGALIVQRRRSATRTGRWLGLHLCFVVAALALTYMTMTALYASGVFVKSGRIAFEHHWSEKIVWLVQEALPNALSLFVLNDNNHRDWAGYLLCAGVMSLILIAGAAIEWRRYGRARGLVWITGLVALPIVAFVVSLVASERYATYRTIFAMTAVLLCFLVASVQALTDQWRAQSRRLLAAVAMSAAFFIAQHHVYSLIAVPQGNEWQLILAGAKHVHLKAAMRPRIFAIASSPADLSTGTIYHDEFGSLSTNSEWVPKEMFKRAMHDLHPELANLESRYDFSEGYKLPPGQHYDLVIDMHQLRRFYTDN